MAERFSQSLGGERRLEETGDDEIRRQLSGKKLTQRRKERGGRCRSDRRSPSAELVETARVTGRHTLLQRERVIASSRAEIGILPSTNKDFSPEFILDEVEGARKDNSKKV